MRNNKGLTLIELMVSVVIVLVLGLFVLQMCGGGYEVGGWGSRNTVTATVVSKHVDTSGSGEVGVESHYMITTDQGTFEVDNGFLLGVWNADEIYGQLQVGRQYTFETKGKRYANMFMQYYPYIVAVQ